MRFAVLSVAAFIAACDLGPEVPVSRHLTSTVAISASDRVLIIDSVLAIDVVAVPSQRNAIALIDLTLTASTATRAANAIRAYTTTIDTAAPSASLGSDPAPRLTIGGVNGFGISGSASITIPGNIAVDVRERGSTVKLTSIGGPCNISSVGSVRVNQAQFDVAALVNSGNAIIDLANGTSRVAVRVTTGNIDAKLPLGLNAVIDAAVSVSGNVIPSYPGLPASFATPGEDYHAVIGAGLSGVPIQLQTGTGDIVIEAR